MLNVFISTTSFAEYDPSPLKMLKDAGMDVRLNPYSRKLTPEECRQHYRDIDGVIAGTEALTAEVLKTAKNLKVISRCGVGTDNIDLTAAQQQGIKVFNTPDSPTPAVAELTVGLILALLRHIPRSDREIRSGKWQKRMGNLLQDKKVGIIGLGRIGQRVAGLITSLGAQVAYCDPAVKEAAYPSLSLDELLSQSDIVSLHASGEGSHGLIGHKELHAMKSGSWLVNCARGGVVDEAALYQALTEGHLAGAALDVFTEEPYKGPLAELDNVILTPHIGSYAREARVNMEIQAAHNLIEGLKGEL